MKYFQVSNKDYAQVTQAFWALQFQFQIDFVSVHGQSTENGMEISIPSDPKWEVVMEAAFILLEEVPYSVTRTSCAVKGFGM
jgi:hypothetical protein